MLRIEADGPWAASGTAVTPGTATSNAIAAQPANRAPIAGAPISLSRKEDQAAYTVNLLLGARDPDGDALTVTNLTGLVDGLTLSGSSLTIDTTAAAFQSLGAGATRRIVIAYRVTDSWGASVPQTLTIVVTGANDAPTVSAQVLQQVAEDSDVVTVDLLRGASDVDAGDTLTVGDVTGLVDGVTLTGATVRLDARNAAFQALAAGERRDIRLSYLVKDQAGGAVRQTAVLTVVGANDAPVVGADLSANVTEDGAAATLDLLAGASDPDAGDVLSVRNLAALPSGLTLSGGKVTIDPSAAAFQSLAEGATRDIALAYQVADQAGAAVDRTATFHVTGKNDAPVVGAAPSLEVGQGAAPAALNLLTGASDPDTGDTLRIADLTGLTAGVELSGATARVDPSASAFAGLGRGERREIVLSYAVTDTLGAKTAQTARIVVVGAGAAPPVATPVITGIDQDTGKPGDNITKSARPAFLGTADAGATVRLYDGEIQIGSGAANAQGRWSITPALLFTDGAHLVTAQASVGTGSSAVSQPYRVTIDTVAPAAATIGLAPSSDTGTAGDGITSAATVTLVGKAEAGATVAIGAQSAIVADNGGFTLPGVALALGSNPLGVTVTDIAGNSSNQTLTLTRTAAAGGVDPVLGWIKIALDEVRSDASVPTEATRALAMQGLAVYDALAAIDGTPAAMVGRKAQAGTSADAAAAAAAHAILTYFYPRDKAALDAKLADSLAGIDAAARDKGVALGRDIATTVIALRAEDGWDAYVDVPGSTAVGKWRPTGPLYLEAQTPQWATLNPFIITSPDAFRPLGPPDLSSSAYADAINQVKSLGALNSTTRTADQTQIARFWSDGAGTFSPPGHWVAIAEQVAEGQGGSLSANARTFAILNSALADAAIAAWDTKYFYQSWRPETAIINADLDGNDATTADPNWRPFLLSPPHPDYVSGHSTFSGAAATVLTDLYGTVAFSTTSLGLPGVTRSFTSFAQAADEAGMSRIYAGIHTSFANADGKALGADVAGAALAFFDASKDVVAPNILVTSGRTLVAAGATAITGQVVDNLVGGGSLTVSVDGAAARAVAVDGDGNFSIAVTPPNDGSGDGVHRYDLVATDAAGNVGKAKTVTVAVDTLAPTVALDALANGDALAAGTRLKGVASDAGAGVAQLTYALNGGAARPIAFDAATGAFDIAIDQTLVTSTGPQSLVVRAVDAAGHATVLTRQLATAALVPFAITEATPLAGAGDVGVTQQPQVRFSRAVDKASVTDASLYLTDASGQRIAATIVLSADGLTANLLPKAAMPGASTIHLNVDGDRIKAAADGAKLDADGDGAAGGKLDARFVTVSTAAIPGTTITGFVVDPGADLKPMTWDDFRAGPDGAPHTADDVFLNRLAGVKVYVIGHEAEAVYTDAQGRFALTNVPTGDVKVAIDGRTATNAPSGSFFPEMVMDATVRPGRENVLMASMGTAESQAANQGRGEVYLPRIPTSILQTVSATAETKVTVAADAAPDLTDAQRGALSLTVQPGSVVDKNGAPLANAKIGIAQVAPELVKDMLPPGLLQHSFDITIQAPDAAVFTTPLQLTFPNIFDMAPGEKTFFLSFDHTTGKLVIDGTATVSADGKSVVTDPGHGVTKPGWHSMTPPGSQASLGPSTSGGPNSPQTPDGPQLPPAPPTRPDDPPPLDEQNKNPKIPEPCKINFAEALPDAGSALMSCIKALGGEDFKKLIEVGSKLVKVTKISVDFINAYADLRNAIKLGSPNIEQKLKLAKTAKDSLIVAYDLVKEAAEYEFDGVRDKIDCVKGGIDTANSLLKQVNDLPSECISLSTRLSIYNLRSVLLVASSTLGIASAALATAEDRLARFGLDVISSIADTVIDAVVLGQERPHGNANLLASSNEGASQPTLDQLFDELFSKANDSISKQKESSAAITDAEGIRFATNGTREVFGNIQQIFFGAIQSFEYLLTTDTGAEIRGHSDASGNVSVFLPASTRFELRVVDLERNRVGYSYGSTNASGQSTAIPALAYIDFVNLTDQDGDGLPDDAEAVFNSSPSKRDSLVAGMSDLAAVQSGFDGANGANALATGIISALTLKGSAQAVELTGSTTDATQQTAYVATGDYGLAIVDASSAFKPTVLAELDLAGTATDVAVAEPLNRAAVATSAGLAIVDVSDRAKPILVRTVGLSGTQVEVIDGIAYANDGASLLAIDATTGELLGELALGGSTVTRLAHEDRTLVALDASGRLTAIAVDEGGQMTRKGSLTVSGQGKLTVAGGVAYLGADTGFTGGYSTVSLANLAAPALISGPDATNIAGGAVALNGSGLGIVVGSPGGAFGTNVVDVVNAADPQNTGAFLTRYTLAQKPNDVAIGSGFAFVADGTGGLQVVNYRAFDTAGKAPVIANFAGPADLNPNVAGNQQIEGSTVRLSATFADDVQVRDVEVLLNGKVIRNDVGYPFDLSATLPTIADNGGTSATLQIRATDTGGNVAASPVVTVQLSPDPVPPRLLSQNVAEGSVRGRTFRNVILTFNEAIAQSSISAATVALVGPGGVAVAPTQIQFRGDDRTVQLTYDTLSYGDYSLKLDATAITDRAGNALGDTVRTTHFQVRAFDAIFTNSAGGSFGTAANWASGALPSPTSDALVEIDAGKVVTVSADQRLASLTEVGPGTLRLQSGVLTVNGALTYEGVLDLNGGTLRGAVVTSTGNELIRGGTLDGVEWRGALKLDGASEQLTIRNGIKVTGADGIGSGVIDLTDGASTAGYDYLYLAGTQTLDQLTIKAGDTSGYYDYLYVTGGSSSTLTLGTGAVLDQDGTYVYLSQYNGGESLDNKGLIKADYLNGQLYVNSLKLINEGTIAASNGNDITFSGGAFTNAATGLLSATGAGTVVTLNAGVGTFDNRGRIRVSAGAVLAMQGSFTADQLGDMQNSGGTVQIAGTLDNGGRTLDVGGAGALGQVQLTSQGTIKGGVVSDAGGSLAFAGGTLDGVEYRGAIKLDGASEQLTIKNGIKVTGADGTGPGVIDLTDGASTAGYDYLYLAGTQTLDQLTIKAGDTSGYYDYIYVTGGPTATLTLGTGAVLDQDGTSVYLSQYSGGETLDNKGLIKADYLNGQLYVNSLKLVNEGTIAASNGNDISFNGGAFTNAATGLLSATGAGTRVTLNAGSATLDNKGRIRVSAGAVLALQGSFAGDQLGDLQNSGGTVELGGTLDNSGKTLELGDGGTLGQVVLTSGGTIRNGVIHDASSTLAFTGGTLDGVEYRGAIKLDGASEQLTIRNGIKVTGADGTGAGVIDLTDGPSTAGYDYLYLAGTQTLDQVTIRAGDTSGYYDYLYVTGGATATLTLGTGAVLDQDGTYIYLSQYNGGEMLDNKGLIKADYLNGTLSVNSLKLVNEGTIAASNGNDITFNGGAFTNAATGLLSATGAGTRVTLNAGAATLDNKGRIRISAGAALSVQGSFTADQLGDTQNTGGTVEIAGTLDNSGRTLDAGGAGALGAVVLASQGTIKGGIVSDAGGALSFTGGTLDGVEYRGALKLDGASEQLTIKNGIKVTGADGTGFGVIDLTDGPSTAGYDYLYLAGTQTLDQLTIKAGDTSGYYDYLYVTGGSTATLTLGAGAVLDQDGTYVYLSQYNGGESLDNKGLIKADYLNGQLSVNSLKLINEGTIAASNGNDITFNGGAFTNAATGLLSATGAGTRVTLNAGSATLDNKGRIRISAGAALSLQGSFTADQLGDTQNSGGTVEIAGTLDNSGRTLDVGGTGALGQVQLTSQGTIKGGVVSDAGSALAFTGGTLDGVEYRGAIKLDGASEQLTLRNGIKVTGADGTGPGVIDLTDGPSSPGYDYLYLSGTQTLDQVTIKAGDTSGYYDQLLVTGGATTTLTLGTGAVIDQDGTTVYLQANSGTETLDNKGLIKADYLNGALYVNSLKVINEGTIAASNGNDITFNGGAFTNATMGLLSATGAGTRVTLNAGTATLDNKGRIRISAGAALSLQGSFTADQLGDTQNSGGTVEIAGTLDNSGRTLDVGGAGALGQVQLTSQGTIKGGVVRDAGSALAFTGGTLDGVEYRGAIKLDGASEQLTIRNGIKVTGADGTGPGVIDLTDGTSTAGYDNLYLAGTQTLDQVTIRAGDTTGYYDYIYVTGGSTATLTLGAGVVLDQDGTTVYLGQYNGGETLDNKGLIKADYLNGALNVSSLKLVNEGTIAASNGNDINFNGGAFTNTVTGLLSAAGAGTRVTLGAGASGAGRIEVHADAVLALGGQTSSKVTFVDAASSTIELMSGATLTGAIGGWSDGDRLDLKGVAATSASVAGGQLAVTTASGTVLRFAVEGDFAGKQFATSTDNAGGSFVTMQAAAHLAAAISVFDVSSAAEIDFTGDLAWRPDEAIAFVGQRMLPTPSGGFALA